MKPPIRWFGSKVRLARRLADLLPEHRHYVKVFAGSAAVLFAKPRSRMETLNDVDQRIVNLFTLLRDPDAAAQLARLVALTPYSRAEFETWRDGTTTGDPLEDARRFMVTAHMSIGTHGEGWSYCVGRTHATRAARWVGVPDRIMAAVTRLVGVQIDSVDWRQCVDRYDTEGVCLFLDPPYHHEVRPNSTTAYDHEMSDDDHTELVARLIGLENAKAVVTHYPHPTYNALTDAGWTSIDFAAWSDNANARRSEQRTERVWLSPGAHRQMALDLT